MVEHFLPAGPGPGEIRSTGPGAGFFAQHRSSNERPPLDVACATVGHAPHDGATHLDVDEPLPAHLFRALLQVANAVSGERLDAGRVVEYLDGDPALIVNVVQHL